MAVGRKHVILRLSAALLVAGLAGPVLAQDQPPAEPGGKVDNLKETF
jgi:hypothetical protein